MLPVQHREVHPPPARFMHALQLARHPTRFFLFVGELDDSNLLSLWSLCAQEFLGKVCAHGVLPDHLRGDTQNVRRRAVILRQADSEFSRIPACLPRCEFLQKKLEAREGSTSKTVDGLVVVTDCENISRISQQTQQTQLRDVRV